MLNDIFGGREQRNQSEDRGAKEAIDLSSMNGRILKAEFDEARGGFWQLDLSNVYTGADFVRRTVIHLFPGWVAVLDEAELEKPEDISLRWHTIEAAQPDDEGNFIVVKDDSRLACRVEALSSNPVSLGLKRHAYQAPYHLDRIGDSLEQRHEPYVELVLKDSSCRILTLFFLAKGDGQESVPWKRSGDKWSWKSKYASGEVKCTDKMLSLRDINSGKVLKVAL